MIGGSPGGGGRPQPRMGGGFNAGMGGMGGFSEHLDEDAMQQAMGQKQMAQQATSQQSAIQAGQGGGKAQSDFSQQQLQEMQAAQGAHGEVAAKQKPPRAMGSITDELFKRPVQDIIEGIKSLFDINALLGINLQHDTPQEQARKKQLHQRWQQLNQEQQQVAQQKYQLEMQKKQAEEEEKQHRKQQEAAQSQTIQAPSSPKKGPDGGGGSKKQKAVTKLQNDRKSLSGPSSSN